MTPRETFRICHKDQSIINEHRPEKTLKSMACQRDLGKIVITPKHTAIFDLLSKLIYKGVTFFQRWHWTLRPKNLFICFMCLFVYKKAPLSILCIDFRTDPKSYPLKSTLTPPLGRSHKCILSGQTLFKPAELYFKV